MVNIFRLDVLNEFLKPTRFVKDSLTFFGGANIENYAYRVKSKNIAALRYSAAKAAKIAEEKEI